MKIQIKLICSKLFTALQCGKYILKYLFTIFLEKVSKILNAIQFSIFRNYLKLFSIQISDRLSLYLILPIKQYSLNVYYFDMPKIGNHKEETHDSNTL